ncbi:hypothetical protein TRICI_005450 [Trichomonascus ciferrii]|uniref:Major facilitator superfamily (MFS) profile domain-containing protein n=1 Tax=Trichomonascus ciferrii TaxID=44093 RepID=A0A642USW3_9ASCO|nr:hypothetical protein TRICI_005450 [Trichomonascus ciferrii]
MSLAREEKDATATDTESLSQQRLVLDEPERPAKWYEGISRLFYWYPKYIPQDQRRLLVKLDFMLLSYICLSYFTKSLDKSNITNAYGTGLREAIEFYDDDLSYAKSLYSAGYIVSMCCGTMFVTRPWARFLVPSLEVVWGIFTFCQSAVKTPSQLFALRFLVGLAEGPIFPTIVFILGSWYKRDEIYRRMMVFSISSGLGGMFSGYLQSAAYSNLAGAGGLEAWQWGFIIDGIVTVPIALYGFLVFPGTPTQIKDKLFWIKAEQLSLAKERMLQSGVSAPTKLSLALLKRTFSAWRVYFFTAFWVLLNVVALPDGTGFPLWLLSKPETYSTQDYNNYPTIQAAIGVVAQIILGGLADSYSIYPILTFVQTLFIISYSSLAAWNIPDGYRWFCFMIIGFDGVNQLIVSGWINRACRHDAEERAFVLGFSDAVSQAMNIWTNIVFYPTSHAPEFRLGYIISTCAAFIMLLLPLVSIYFEKRDAKSLKPIVT